MTKFSARTFHAIAEELGCDPELVGATAMRLKLRSKADLKAAVEAYLAGEKAKAEKADAKTDEPTGDDEPKAKPNKKAPLTLSQRRALVKLQAEPQNPKTAFKALPYDYLESVGLVRRIQGDNTDDPTLQTGTFVLTLLGMERAAEINPLYVVWAAGESVAGDKTRPSAGTHRAKATVLL